MLIKSNTVVRVVQLQEYNVAVAVNRKVHAEHARIKHLAGNLDCGSVNIPHIRIWRKLRDLNSVYLIALISGLVSTVRTIGSVLV